MRTIAIFISLGLFFLKLNSSFSKDLQLQSKVSIGELAEKLSKESVQIKKDSKLCSKVYLDFLKQIELQNTFVRGEITDERKAQQIDLFHEKLFGWLTDKSCVWKNKNKSVQLKLIFNYFADLTYDENSFLALKKIIYYRQQFLKNIYINRKSLLDFKITHQDFISLRLPLPLARILTVEAKNWTQKPSARKFSRLNLSFQKNPYQSLSRLYAAEELSLPEMAKNLWTDQDVQLIKQQLTTVSALIIDFASVAYEKKTALKLTKLEDLVSAGILQLIPLNYNTGQSFKLTDLQMLQTL